MSSNYQLMKEHLRLNNCPICNSEIVYYDVEDCDCPNGCFQVFNFEMNGKTFWRVDIFDSVFSFCYEDTQDNLKLELADMYAKIEYWKENDRYLMEILSK